MAKTTGVSGTSFRGADTTIRFFRNADETLNRLSVGELRKDAREVAARVRLPTRRRKDLTLSTKAGMGPRGAFSQVIMRGPGALAIEFGTRRTRAFAPLRRALRGA